MDKHAVAAVLDEIGLLLELQGENPFKTRAYANAARAIEALPGDLRPLVESGELRQIKGLGPATAEKVATLVTTGRLPYYDELRARIPAGLLDVLKIPGVGPKKAKLLHDTLGIDSLDALEAACRANRLSGVPGFGAKSQEKILGGIERVRTSGERVLYATAAREAERLFALVRALPGVTRVAVAGSVRRRRETAKDVDLLCAARAADTPAIMEAFVADGAVESVTAHGETKSSVRLHAGLNADLRVVRDHEFAAALMYFTGSKEHNVALRGRALRLGYSLNEYALTRDDEPVPAADEADIYRALGLSYIEPELREDGGEIEAAETGTLPALLTRGDVRGVLHVHSTWSDGANTLEEMIDAAEAAGFEYIGMSEHSQSAAYANGLKPDRLRAYLDAIDELQQKPGRRIRIFKGSECDILADGSLDYEDALLARLDFVVASVHSRFSMDRAAMTERIVRAVRHPATTILGHPTGRLLLERESYAVDMEAVIAAAAECDVAIELNAHPSRLDVDWRLGRAIRAAGACVSIDPDAHDTEGLAHVEYGVGIARKAWLARADVLNVRGADDLSAWFAARRARRGA